MACGWWSQFCSWSIGEIISVPVIPNSLQEMALHNCHDVIVQVIKGTEKTLDRLKHACGLLDWNGKATELYCDVCQQSKLPMPLAVPMSLSLIFQLVNHSKCWLLMSLKFPCWAKEIVSCWYFKTTSQSGLKQYLCQSCQTKQLKGLYECWLTSEILHSDQGRTSRAQS